MSLIFCLNTILTEFRPLFNRTSRCSARSFLDLSHTGARRLSPRFIKQSDPRPGMGRW